MEDYSENIVSLVRAYLKADTSDIAMRKKISPITIRFKNLSVMTLTSTPTNEVLPGYLREEVRPLNHYEKTELQALLFYVSHVNNMTETDLRRDIECDLDIQSLEKMTFTEFIRVRGYLHHRAQQQSAQSAP